MRGKKAKEIRKYVRKLWGQTPPYRHKDFWYDNFRQLYRKAKKHYTRTGQMLP